MWHILYSFIIIKFYLNNITCIKNRKILSKKDNLEFIGHILNVCDKFLTKIVDLIAKKMYKNKKSQIHYFLEQNFVPNKVILWKFKSIYYGIIYFSKSICLN